MNAMEYDSFLAFWTFLLLVNQQEHQQELKGEAHDGCPASSFLPPLQHWSAAKSWQRHDTHKNKLAIKHYIKDKPIK